MKIMSNKELEEYYKAGHSLYSIKIDTEKGCLTVRKLNIFSASLFKDKMDTTYVEEGVFKAIAQEANLNKIKMKLITEFTLDLFDRKDVLENIIKEYYANLDDNLVDAAKGLLGEEQLTMEDIS